MATRVIFGHLIRYSLASLQQGWNAVLADHPEAKLISIQDKSSFDYEALHLFYSLEVPEDPK